MENLLIKHGLRSLFFAAAAVLVGGAGPAESASFRGLGDLSGGAFESSAFGVSSDGSVVVGYSIAAAGGEAFRWTEVGGMVALGELPGGISLSVARGVSDDGSVVVGNSQSGYSDEAFRWTSGSGMVGLGVLSGGEFQASHAAGVSSDGSVVVGRAYHGFTEAFRWSSGGGMAGLGDLPGRFTTSIANGVSGDGTVVVGQGSSDSGLEAFRWTAAQGMIALGDLPGGPFNSSATAVSSDGSVVVGFSQSGYDANLRVQSQAFRWTASGGMVGLGGLPGGELRSAAADTSRDGSVVVGTAEGDVAFIWDEAHGMRAIQSVLTNLHGLDLTGWALWSAMAVSDDGLTVVGFGLNPSGSVEAWIAVIPEPSTALLIGLGMVLLGARRRR